MEVRRLAMSTALTALASLQCVSFESAASPLPPGSYGCYTYNPKPNYVGEIAINGGRYTVARFGTDGEYDYDPKSGKVAWRGKPPMGFETAVLETDATSGRKVLRMYPKAADIDNKWKAAVCSPKESVSVNVAPSRASPATSGASTGATTSSASMFKPGDKVTAEFIGVPYGATILAVEGGRVRVHYDDPKSKDEWVDAGRIKARK